VPLATAQRDISHDWRAAYTRYLPIAVPGPSTTPPPTRVPAPRPTAAATSAPAPAPTQAAVPSEVTAVCNDGTFSYSQHRRGTCSHHGGVARWINRPPS
jgi:hypothetical protein